MAAPEISIRPGVADRKLVEDIANEAELQRDEQLKATLATNALLAKLAWIITVDTTAIVTAILFG